MAGSHGDLFREIGALVVAAHGGDSIDLNVSSADLAERYINLGVPAETIARAIARSLGAISMSMAIMSGKDRPLALDAPIQLGAVRGRRGVDAPLFPDLDEGPARAAASLFPSGVRLAVLS